MSRSTWVLLVVIGLIVVALYVVGLPRGGGTEKPLELELDAGYAQATPIAAAALADPGRCLANNLMRVQANKSCTFTIGSTWSIRRRALVLKGSTPGLSAHVFPNGDHPERNVDADLKAQETELPVDRAGATLRFVCASPVQCVTTIQPP